VAEPQVKTPAPNEKSLMQLEQVLEGIWTKIRRLSDAHTLVQRENRSLQNELQLVKSKGRESQEELDRCHNEIRLLRVDLERARTGEGESLKINQQNTELQTRLTSLVAAYDEANSKAQSQHDELGLLNLKLAEKDQLVEYERVEKKSINKVLDELSIAHNNVLATVEELKRSLEALRLENTTVRRQLEEFSAQNAMVHVEKEQLLSRLEQISGAENELLKNKDNAEQKFQDARQRETELTDELRKLKDEIVFYHRTIEKLKNENADAQETLLAETNKLQMARDELKKKLIEIEQQKSDISRMKSDGEIVLDPVGREELKEHIRELIASINSHL
jgi:chromosome segregation ATPase